MSGRGRHVVRLRRGRPRRGGEGAGRGGRVRLGRLEVFVLVVPVVAVERHGPVVVHAALWRRGRAPVRVGGELCRRGVEAVER